MQMDGARTPTAMTVPKATLIGPIHNTITSHPTCSCGLSKVMYMGQPPSQGLSSSCSLGLERESGTPGGGGGGGGEGGRRERLRTRLV